MIFFYERLSKNQALDSNEYWNNEMRTKEGRNQQKVKKKKIVIFHQEIVR